MNVAKIEINGSKKFWISGVDFAQPTQIEYARHLVLFLRRNSIDTIVNLSDYPITEQYNEVYKNAGVSKILKFPLKDRLYHPNEYNALNELFDDIYNKCGYNVLVHCTAGINRSATFIAHACIKHTFISNERVIKIIKYCNAKQRETPAIVNKSFLDYLLRLKN